MDKTAERTRLEEILAEWDLNDKDTTITVNNTLSNVSVTSPYTYTSGITLGAYPNAIYTTGTNTTAPWTTFNPNNVSAKINLNGENADIEVNGWSLVAAVKRIEERLDLFQPNPELEKEWADLRALGEQYRQLEQYIKEKQSTWNRLKAMPPPEID